MLLSMVLISISIMISDIGDEIIYFDYLSPVIPVLYMKPVSQQASGCGDGNAAGVLPDSYLRRSVGNHFRKRELPISLHRYPTKLAAHRGRGSYGGNRIAPR